MNVMEDVLRKRIDPALTPRTLSEIGSRALGRPVEASCATVLTGGCWNRVVGVDFRDESTRLVYKISSRPVAPDIEREMAVLRYFSEHTSLPVPRPYLYDGSCALIPGPLLVMERLSGAVLHEAAAYLSPAQRAEVSAQIARHLAELHRARTPGFGGVELAAEDRHPRWPEFWLPRFHSAMEDSRQEGHLPAEVLERAERVSRGFDTLLEIGRQATLTHYDIWSGNVMVALEDGAVRVTGYLDSPGYWADRAREISFLEMFGLRDGAFSRVYGGAYPEDPGFGARKAAYNLKMHMRHVSMYPGEAYYRQGVVECLSALERVL